MAIEAILAPRTLSTLQCAGLEPDGFQTVAASGIHDSIILQTIMSIMKDKLQGLSGLACSLIAAACAFSGTAPWITAAFALVAGIECLRFGLSGGRRHD